MMRKLGGMGRKEFITENPEIFCLASPVFIFHERMF